MAVITNPYPYLAGVELTDEQLLNTCVKKGTVIKLDSRQTVTVEIDSVEYADVPVWIHTDCGARLAAIKEGSEEGVDPADYFLDAALMFPLPEGITVYDHSDVSQQTVAPEVFVIVHTDGEGTKTALGVIGIISSIDQEFPANENPFRTYRPYVLFSARTISVITPIVTSQQKWYLYDLFEDAIAEIPTYTAGVPGTPFFEASEIENSTAAKTYLDAFLSESLRVNCPFWAKTSRDRIGQTVQGYYPYYDEDGVETSPGATYYNSSPTPPAQDWSITSLGGYGSEEASADAAGDGTHTANFTKFNDGTDILGTVIGDNIASSDRILEGRTYFGEDASVRYVADMVKDNVLGNDGTSPFYYREDYDETRAITLSVTIGDNTVNAATTYPWSHMTGYSSDLVGNYFIMRDEKYFDVRLKTPENMLWNCAIYSLYLPYYYYRTLYNPSVPSSGAYDLEDVRVIDNAVFDEDSLISDYDGLSDAFALALRNLSLVADFSGGMKHGVEVKGLYFVPFNIDIALLE